MKKKFIYDGDVTICILEFDSRLLFDNLYKHINGGLSKFIFKTIIDSSEITLYSTKDLFYSGIFRTVGISKRMQEDKYDKKTGEDIAYYKALYKMKRKRINMLKNFNSISSVLFDNILNSSKEGIFKEASSFIELGEKIDSYSKF